mmetsp:Transcript_18744/g.39886  ORF Transcript_18744/g.39886 Transcript_18744/m.39886 type:complete len:142 (+) Transcript_18744:3-428(+)
MRRCHLISNIHDTLQLRFQEDGRSTACFGWCPILSRSCFSPTPFYVRGSMHKSVPLDYDVRGIDQSWPYTHDASKTAQLTGLWAGSARVILLKHMLTKLENSYLHTDSVPFCLSLTPQQPCATPQLLSLRLVFACCNALMP